MHQKLVRKQQCVCLQIREHLCVFEFSHSNTGLRCTFSAFRTPPESNAFTSWDLSLLNRLKGKNMLELFHPLLPSFRPSVSRIRRPLISDRKLHCSCLSIVNHHGEVLFGTPLCPLVLVFCVGMSFISKPMKSLCRVLLLRVAHSVCCSRVH